MSSELRSSPILRKEGLAMTNLAPRVKRVVLRFGERARQLADAAFLAVGRLQSRHEPSVARLARRTSSRELLQRELGTGALTDWLRMQGSSHGRLLSAVVKTCGSTAGFLARATDPNGCS